MARQKVSNAGAYKKPASGASVPPDVAGRELEARRAERLQAREMLRSGRTPLQVIAVAERGVAVQEETLRQTQAAYPPPELACREGCTWCCHLTVGTAVPEVARIIAYLRSALSAEEWNALRERANRLGELRRQLRPAKRGDVRLPCPLLVEGRCIAYPVRPLTCRGCNSTDAAACESYLKTPGQKTLPDYAPQQRLAAFVLDGMRAGLSESGLKDDLLELSAALRIALEAPDAIERWLAGESVFAPARLP
jgi:hypothetical protein